MRIKKIQINNKKRKKNLVKHKSKITALSELF